ncbi:MAG: hypothetical protein VXU41_02190 [Pseudomonadota bacterium]|nr:hypothetical protein [Pseudomonadota bacterium]
MKFYQFIILFILLGCGYSSVNNLEKEPLNVFVSFKNNPLNQSLLSEIRKSSSFLNLRLSSQENADVEIEITNHRIGKFLNTTDENFFPAVGTLDYQLDFYLKNNSNKEFIEFFTNENFAYDTDSILSNEQKIEEIKINFFKQALNEITFRLSNFSAL